MIIDRIETLDRRRKKIFADGEFAFALYLGEIRQLGLEEGWGAGRGAVSVKFSVKSYSSAPESGQSIGSSVRPGPRRSCGGSCGITAILRQLSIM